jgi:hypothetical protein
MFKHSKSTYGQYSLSNVVFGIKYAPSIFKIGKDFNILMIKEQDELQFLKFIFLIYFLCF